MASTTPISPTCWLRLHRHHPGRYLPAVLAILGVATLVVALARPEVWRDRPREQGSIVLAIDVSGSMAADDVEPYRLRAAQDAAKRFAETVPDQYQVGLVSFSGVAAVVPTTDHRPPLIRPRGRQPDRRRRDRDW